MNNIYLGADWHFSKWDKEKQILKHNDKRNRDILIKYKSMIKPNDIFIFLGDLSEIREDNTDEVKKCIEQLKYLNGTKIFIRGNNDIMPDNYYTDELGFAFCFDGFKLGDFIFTHKPIKIKEKEINIHGHLHSATTYWECEPKNHVDAFTRSFKNYPISLGALLNKGYFIDKELISDDRINKLKCDLFKYINQ